MFWKCFSWSFDGSEHIWLIATVVSFVQNNLEHNLIKVVSIDALLVLFYGFSYNGVYILISMSIHQKMLKGPALKSLGLYISVFHDMLDKGAF